jgi:hypothetical protein
MENVLVYVVVAAFGIGISIVITYSVVLAATRNALTDHYKMVRWYEETGEWEYEMGNWKNQPRDFDSAERGFDDPRV